MNFKIEVKLDNDTVIETVIEAENNEAAANLIKIQYPNYKTIKFSPTSQTPTE